MVIRSRRHEVGEDHEQWSRPAAPRSSSAAAPRLLAVEQVELVEDHAPCGRPRSGASDGRRTISSSLVLGDRGADAADLAHVGMLAGEHQPGVALVGVVAAGEQQRGERPGRLRAWSSRPARRTGRRAPAARRPRHAAGRPRAALADDVVPDRGLAAVTKATPASRSSSRRIARRHVVDRAHRLHGDPPALGSAAAIVAEPVERPARGTRRLGARSGRGRGRLIRSRSRRRACRGRSRRSGQRAADRPLVELCGSRRRRARRP